jgi:hypothetical protein
VHAVLAALTAAFTSLLSYHYHGCRSRLANGTEDKASLHAAEPVSPSVCAWEKGGEGEDSAACKQPAFPDASRKTPTPLAMRVALLQVGAGEKWICTRWFCEEDEIE